jgi:hypothetical protein
MAPKPEDETMLFLPFRRDIDHFVFNQEPLPASIQQVKKATIVMANLRGLFQRQMVPFPGAECRIVWEQNEWRRFLKDETRLKNGGGAVLKVAAIPVDTVKRFFRPLRQVVK